MVKNGNFGGKIGLHTERSSHDNFSVKCQQGEICNVGGSNTMGEGFAKKGQKCIKTSSLGPCFYKIPNNSLSVLNKTHPISIRLA